jgi:hypothetical protein
MTQTVFRSLALLITLAMGLSPEVANAAPAKFDCDTAAGKYSEFNLPQLGPNYHLSGRLSAKEYRPDRDWFPVANVRFVSADRRIFGGIRLQIPAGSGRVELVVQSKTGEQPRDIGVAVLRKGDAAAFSLDVIDGKMTITVGGQGFPGPDVGAGAAVNLTCSSGEFLFEDVDWDLQPKRS